MAFILDELEITRELDVGRIEIFPIAETAGAMKDVFEICSASPRVRRISGVAHSVPGGDYYRSLGAQWHSDGIEALYSGSMTVMAGRAAGLESILCGPIAAIADLDHVRDVLLRGRGLGANAAMVIHPSHIALVHEVFAPTRAEIAEALEVLRTMSAAEARGEAAVVVGGRMVDLVHVRTSQEIVRRAIEAGLDVGDGVAGTAGE